MKYIIWGPVDGRVLNLQIMYYYVLYVSFEGFVIYWSALL